MGKRPSVFCLVAPARAGDLLDALVAHFEDDPAVTVMVDRRLRSHAGPPASGDRRAPTVVRDRLGALPAELRGEPGDVRFLQRLEPVHRLYADLDMARLLELCRGEDADAVSEMLWRLHERVRVRLRRRVAHDALDAATVEVWGRVLDALAAGTPRGEISVWIDSIVDRYASRRSAAAS